MLNSTKSLFEKFRVFCGRWAPPVILFITILSFVLITYLWIELSSITRAQGETLASVTTTREQVSALLTIIVGMVARRVIVMAIIGTYLFLPGFAAFALALPGALVWRRPSRFLLLRRFYASDESRELKTVIRRHIAPLGHIYTLADRDIHIPWYIRYPVVFTQLVFLHFRARRLKSTRALNRLLRGMNVRWARNINWIVAWRKPFALRCSDELWKQAVTELTDRVDAVLIDVSVPSDSLEWEIRECMSKGLLNRTAYLTRNPNIEEVRDYLNSVGVSEIGTDQIVYYGAGEVGPLPGLLARIKHSDLRSKTTAAARSQLNAALAMAGPFVWIISLLAFLLWVTETHDERDPSSRHFWAEVQAVEQAENRQQAFEGLLKKIGDGPSQHDYFDRSINFIFEEVNELSLFEDFDAVVVPFFVEEWDRTPAWRMKILESLNHAASPGGVPVWRKALAGSSGPPSDMLKLILSGIKRSRASQITPDLLSRLDTASYEIQQQIIETIGEVREVSAVPVLFRKYILEPSGPEQEALGESVRGALKKILPSQFLTLQSSSPSPFQKRALNTLVLGDTPARQRQFITALLQHGERVERKYKFSFPQQGMRLPSPANGISVLMGILEYVTPGRNHQFSYCPIFEDYEKVMVTAGYLYDIALFLADDRTESWDRFMRNTILVKDAGIPRVAVIFDTSVTGGSGEENAAYELKLKSRLAEVGFAEQDITVISVPLSSTSEANGSISKLEAALESLRSVPAVEEREALYALASVVDLQNRETIALGYTERGTIRTGDTLEVVGRDEHKVSIKVTGKYHLFDSGSRIGLWLEVPGGYKLLPGQVLASPGSISSYERFLAMVYFLNPAEGGVRMPFIPGYTRDYKFRTSLVQVDKISLPPTPLKWGDLAMLMLKLKEPIPLETGQRFLILKQDQAIGIGVVARLLADGEEAQPQLRNATSQLAASADELLNLYQTLIQQERVAEAENLLQFVLAVAVGEEDPVLEIKSLMLMAKFLWTPGESSANRIQYIEALGYYQRALKVYHRMVDKKEPDIDHLGGEAVILANLVYLNSALGVSESASKYYRQLLKILPELRSHPQGAPIVQYIENLLRQKKVGVK